MEHKNIATAIAVFALWLVIVLVYLGLAISSGQDVIVYTAKTVCQRDTLALADYYIKILCSYSTNMSREFHLDHRKRELNMIMKSL